MTLSRSLSLASERPPPPFNPHLLGPKLTAWLRLRASSQASGEWTSIVDVLNPGNPVTQTDADRRAAVGADANGLPTMVFDGSDVHSWAITAANNNRSAIGWWLQYKPATITGVQRLLHINAGGAQIQFYQNGSVLTAECYTNGAAGRFGSTASGTLTAAAWHRIYLRYKNQGDDTSLAIYVNAVAKTLTYGNLGGGAALALLNATSGSMLIGGASDSDTPTQPIANGGQLGPDTYVLQDDLSAAEITALDAFDRAA